MKNIISLLSFSFIIAIICIIPNQNATAQAQKVSFPFFAEFTSCTGENIVISGRQTILIKSMEDGNGGRHINVRMTIHGKGTGDQGNDYVLNETSYLFYNGAFPPYTEKATAGTHVSSVLVSKGNAPNIKVQWIDHVTYNANGEFVADIELSKTTCQ